MCVTTHLRITAILILCLSFLTARAQPDLDQLDRYIAQAQQTWPVPGLAVAVVKDGEVVLAKGYGVRELRKAELVDEHTLFAIASNTKAFISTAVAMLVEEGKLDWDDPVRKHLPWFTLYDPYVSEHTTVRDLLCHRAGLGTFSGDAIWYKSQYTAEDIVRHARYVPQAYEFRAGYGYSNLMFIAAGEVIRAASGLPWDAFVRERIFRPLEMSRTQTSTRALAGMANVATPHKTRGMHNEPIAWVNWDNMGAAGGIIASVRDMANWMQLQLDGGVYRSDTLFSARSQETFWTPHNSFPVTAGTKRQFPSRHYAGYGLGWSLYDHGGRMVATHSGGYDGMYSRVLLIPEERLGIVVLTNSMTGIGTSLGYYIMDYFLNMETKDWSAIGLEGHNRGAARWDQRIDERKKERKTDATPTLPLDKYAGIYRDPMFGDIEVRLESGLLQLHFPTAPALDARLSPWHYDTFEINWNETHAWFDFGTVQFVTDNNHQVMGLRFDVPNDDIFFDEIHAKRVAEE